MAIDMNVEPIKFLTEKSVRARNEMEKSQAIKQPMKCLVKEDLFQDGFTLKTDAPYPRVGLDEVKIRVLATAVCGTDKSIYHSARSEGIRKVMQRYLEPPLNYRPIIVGHEFCGIVEAIGEGVGAARFSDVPAHLILEPGDYVTAEMHLSCGHCLLCRTGNEHVCTQVKVKGIHLDGCFAQSVVVPYKNVILLGKGGDTTKIPPRIGAMLDAFGNAVHSVDVADVVGKSVAILGAGPLGLMSTLLCRHFGASCIYVTEAADAEHRFTLARQFGADQCYDVSKGSNQLYQAIEKHERNANGVDVVMEMSGSPKAYEDAFRIIRNGGKVVLVGISPKPLSSFDIAEGVIFKGVTVQGIFGRKMFVTWETMLRLLNDKHLDVNKKLERILSARTYLLEEHVEAFEALAKGDEMKLVFSPDLSSDSQ